MLSHRAKLVHTYPGLVVACFLLLSGCSLLGPEENEQIQQIFVSDMYGPDRAAAGETVTFSLHGFALEASVRVESRSNRHVEVTVWADLSHLSEELCGTPPLPHLGHVETAVPEAGAYTVRVLQPDGSVLEKQVMIIEA